MFMWTQKFNSNSTFQAEGIKTAWQESHWSRNTAPTTSSRGAQASWRQSLHSRKIWWSLWPRLSCLHPWRPQLCPLRCPCHLGHLPLSSRLQPSLLHCWGLATGPSGPRPPPSSLPLTKHWEPARPRQARPVGRCRRTAQRIQQCKYPTYALTKCRPPPSPTSRHRRRPSSRAPSLPVPSPPYPCQLVYLRYLSFLKIYWSEKENRPVCSHDMVIWLRNKMESLPDRLEQEVGSSPDVCK